MSNARFISSRRRFLVGSALAAGSWLVPGLRNAVWAAGSDAPEKPQVRVGFIPLTDCAPIVMAALKGFDKKHGISLQPSKEASWAAVRDKLASGELDAAHALYSMIYGLHLGIAGKQQAMANLMTLNNNGQAITLSNQLRTQGVIDGSSLQQRVAASEPGTYRFAHTFPTGTHAMWLYYWLASVGIDPFRDLRLLVVPPPQMVMNMKIGNLSGFCVGEPWNQRAISENVGYTAVTSQQVWPDHPEKILATRAQWVNDNPHTARALTAAVLEAARWIDASDDNRRETARAIAGRAWLNTQADTITGRMLGQYQDGLGHRWQDAHGMQFFRDGEVSFPWLSDGMWFLTQLQRWGLLKQQPDYHAVARAINRTEVYRQAASAVGNIVVPQSEMRRSTLIDGRVWDGSNPAAWATDFAIKRRGEPA
ncbi:nitrate/bicarbonate ABC transporter substrate-binding protein [Mixta theicola]|uniref:Nitrate/bicarbonate ABC transporter substrate-binding protein n=1 Tax=Mixta theicola TaxID=1458355 RepID=A0A2K1Q5E9_9GAMM|nr:CmpA/NrtA family ABC transporter substrate-binding protein [Mixta theicola]PNS10260.1 nitrate/bicarbonate ABC transporter substrate-binding protein [Mixta theicola]GLR09525.1 nitrate transporter component [Mixta theicola]